MGWPAFQVRAVAITFQTSDAHSREDSEAGWAHHGTGIWAGVQPEQGSLTQEGPAKGRVAQSSEFKLLELSKHIVSSPALARKQRQDLSSKFQEKQLEKIT